MAAHLHQMVLWHQMLFPGGPGDMAQPSCPASSLGKERRMGEQEQEQPKGFTQRMDPMETFYRCQRARDQALVKLYGITRADMTTDTGTGNCSVARD